jgi:anti-sigma factor RsiW
MEHNQIQEQLADFEEGQLPDAQMRLVLHHLEGCPECREALRQWQQARQSVADCVTPEPSDSFVQRVMARVETLPAGSAFRIPEWLYPELGVAAAATLLFVVGYFGVPLPTVSAERLLDSFQPRGGEWINTLHEPHKSAVEILWEGP